MPTSIYLARLGCLTVVALGVARGLGGCGESTPSDSSQASSDAGALPGPSSSSSPTPTPGTNDGGVDSGAPTAEDGGVDSGGPTTEDAGEDAGADAGMIVVADLTTDFSKTSNPAGAWSYGYTLGNPSGDGGALIVFPKLITGAAGVPGWLDPDHQSLNAPGIFRNESAGPVNGIQPGEVSLHPGNQGEYTVARWTVPTAGSYAVTLEFKTGDTGDTDGLFLHNGQVLVTEGSTSTAGVHERVVVAAAGDRLEVAVGPKGNFQFDSTPVVFTIRASAP